MNIDVMSLIIFISGTFILIYGIFFAPTEEEEKMIDSSMDFSKMDELLNNLENKLGDADKMILELDKFSEYVTKEMQEKYKEMMFLYQMIDDKTKAAEKEAKEAKEMKAKVEEREKELKKEEDRRALEEARRMQLLKNEEIKRNAVKSFYTSSNGLNVMPEISIAKKETVSPVMVAKSSFDDVVYMYENGKDVEDIAKTLGKGKGEVRLMLDLMGKEG